MAGLTEYEKSFSGRAVRGINYTRQVITPENMEWLKSLPIYHREDELEFVHSSLIRTEEWHYLTLGGALIGSNLQDIHKNFKAMKGQVCFVGHSHFPTIFFEKRPGNIKLIDPSKPLYELQDRRAIIDVGSIGCPRTSSKKGSLVIYKRETQRVCFRRFKV